MTGLDPTYIRALEHGDEAAAVAHVLSLADAGALPVDVMLDVIARAQEEIGRRWASGEWTVANEHAATAISEVATAALATRIPSPRSPLGHVVLACAEREWHGLPARMVAHALRAAGWRTTFLGASTPPHRLTRHLDDFDADAVALSCSVFAALPAARRTIEAVRAIGLPVIVGGRAFGDGDARARSLGASAWAGDARTAVAEVERLVRADSAPQPLPSLRHRGADDHAELLLRFGEFRTGTRRRWLAELDGRSTDGEHRGLYDDAVDHALHSLSAALLADDPGMLGEADSWLHGLFDARGLEPTAVPALWRSLRRTVGELLPEAARQLDALYARA